MKTNWQLVDCTVLFKDKWVTILRKRYHAGAKQSEETFHVINRSDFVLVVAIDSEDQLLLVRQYRHGTDQSYWGLPAGYIDPNEKALQAALRELEEETGYIADRATFIGELHPLPGYVRSTAHVVLCESLHNEQGNLPDSEIEKVELVPLEVVVERIVSGEINEMQAVGAILLVQEVLKRVTRDQNNP